MSSDLDHEEHSKRARIVNAVASYPEDAEVSNQAVARLTDASPSYVYQLRTALTEGDLSEDEIAELSDDELQSRYGERLQEILEEQEETGQTEEGTGDAEENQSGENEDGERARQSEQEREESGEDDTEFSKRTRILNVLSVYPDRYQMSNQAIAELADASPSYVYQVRSAIADGDITDDEIQAALDSKLQSQYRDRVGGLLEEYGISRTIEEAEDPVESEVEEETPSESSPSDTAGEDGTVPVTDVRDVRDVFQQYRADADFERDHFEGPAANVAEEKYFIANRAVELLDQLINGSDTQREHHATARE